MIVRGVQAEHVNNVWPFISWMMEKVCSETGYFDKDDIKKFLEDRDMQLWIVLDDEKIKNITVTEIINFPRKKVCRIVFCTGEDYEEWAGCIKLLEDWARSQDAELQPFARPGWEKSLGQLGYKKTHVLFEKRSVS